MPDCDESVLRCRSDDDLVALSGADFFSGERVRCEFSFVGDTLIVGEGGAEELSSGFFLVEGLKRFGSGIEKKIAGAIFFRYCEGPR